MLRYLTSGESHGKSLISILDGIPANIELNIDEINYELEKRQGGYGRGGRMKIEKDKINILGGVRGKITLGGPISIEIKNKDYENWIQYMNPMDNIDFETKKVEKVKSTQKSYNSIKLTWAKPSGAYGYQIYRSTSKNGKYTKIKKDGSA